MRLFDTGFTSFRPEPKPNACLSGTSYNVFQPKPKGNARLSGTSLVIPSRRTWSSHSTSVHIPERFRRTVDVVFSHIFSSPLVETDQKRAHKRAVSMYC